MGMLLILIGWLPLLLPAPSLEDNGKKTTIGESAEAAAAVEADVEGGAAKTTPLSEVVGGGRLRSSLALSSALPASSSNPLLPPISKEDAKAEAEDAETEVRCGDDACALQTASIAVVAAAVAVSA